MMLHTPSMRPWIGLAALVATLASGSAEAAETRRFALVVGNNHPLPGHGYAPLEYADDDALRFATFMRRLGAKVQVLVGPDAATAERYPELAKDSLPPRRARVLDAVALLAQDLAAAEGFEREVYLYFSGHGSVTSSKAYLHLLDAPFTRTDLHASVLERLSAERVHVIVDSCHAYFLVNDRGERVPAADDTVDLSRYPRAGFLLSTSAKKEVQEWSGYEAGVFSYQLLGAMQGAADVNLDGKVTYAEAHAYLVAANMDVTNPAARVKPFVRRPAVGDRVLVDLTTLPPDRRLAVPEALAGHFYVVSGRGERLLDANKPAGLPMALVMPEQGELLLWAGTEAYGVQRGGPGASFVRTSSNARAKEPAARGSVADELRQNLFRRPLTREFVAGLDAAVAFDAPLGAATRAFAAPRPRPASVILWTAGGLGLVTAAVATAVYADARATANPGVLTPDNREAVDAARVRADRSRAVMVAGYTSAAMLGLAGMLYEWMESGPAPVEVAFAKDGVVIGGQW